MKEALVEKVVCPQCGGKLSLSAGEKDKDEIISGRLSCPKGHAYAVEKGVPCLIAREIWSDTKKETESSFSSKWRRIPDYMKKASHFYNQWYLDRYRFKTVEGLQKFLADKKTILDAGTGTGRDSKMYSENSDAQVFGIDISEGIYFAYNNLKDRKNLNLVRADLTKLPFPKEFFDLIACDQVMHHTPNTKESLRALLNHLKPGGHILFYVYKVKGPIREFCDNFIRETTTKMTEEECYKFSEAITDFGRSLAKLKLDIDVPTSMPLLQMDKGKYNLQRFFHWHIFKCFWNDDFDYETNVMINYDWYHPLDAHRHTVPELKGWCEEMNLEIKLIDEIEAGISVMAVKR